jgi:hypothetical protein
MTRLSDVWRALTADRRRTALVSLGLFVSMLLPWYSKTDTFVVSGAAKATGQSLSAFQAFSFVEAAVLLVSAGVLALLFARAEGRDFQLPGGDGTIVTIAGAWAAILIFYRLLDKPGLSGNARVTSTVGVQWGIFIALLLALGLAYTGRRIRAGERAEPPLARAGRGPGRGPSPRGAEQPGGSRLADVYEDPSDDLSERETTVRREPLTAATRVVEAPASEASSTLPEAGEAETQLLRARTRPRSSRPRLPPAPPARGKPDRQAPAEQMSFEDSPPEDD